MGKVEFEDEAGISHGEVINTRDVITFQGESVAELKMAFQESGDDYLAFCKERGEELNKPFSGQFVTRIPPELVILVENGPTPQARILVENGPTLNDLL